MTDPLCARCIAHRALQFCRLAQNAAKGGLNISGNRQEEIAHYKQLITELYERGKLYDECGTTVMPYSSRCWANYL